jgi:hypothetical protein
MSDAYGAIVVGFSDDFDGDKDRIAEALSTLNLSNDQVAFVVKGDDIWTDCGGSSDVQYPSLYPTRPKTVLIERNGKETEKPFMEVTTEEFEDIVEAVDEELIPLKEIAATLSGHITAGTLFVTCCSNEKQRSVDGQFLQVNADGSASRAMISHWVGGHAVFDTENCG